MKSLRFTSKAVILEKYVFQPSPRKLIMKTNICHLPNALPKIEKDRTRLRQLVSSAAVGFFVTGALALNTEGVLQTIAVGVFCGCLLTILFMGSKSFAPSC